MVHPIRNDLNGKWWLWGIQCVDGGHLRPTACRNLKAKGVPLREASSANWQASQGASLVNSIPEIPVMPREAALKCTYWTASCPYIRPAAKETMTDQMSELDEYDGTCHCMQRVLYLLGSISHLTACAWVAYVLCCRVRVDAEPGLPRKARKALLSIATNDSASGIWPLAAATTSCIRPSPAPAWALGLLLADALRMNTALGSAASWAPALLTACCTCTTALHWNSERLFWWAWTFSA